MKILLFVLLFLPGTVAAQYFTNTCLKFDTIVLHPNVPYSSDLKMKVTGCIGQRVFAADSFDMDHARGAIRLFNKELKTYAFSRIKVITGAYIRSAAGETWTGLMEWHFAGEADAVYVEKALNKLDRGIIRHTIYPAACYFLRSGKKIYVIRYGPRSTGNRDVDEIFNCIRLSIN